MKKVLFIFCFLLARASFGAITVTNDFQTNSSCTGTGSVGCTTTGVNSTGANSATCIVVYNNGSTPTVSDNKSSTFTARTPKVGGFATVVEYDAKGVSGGSGHTFTLGGSGVFGQITCLTFAGGNTSTLFDHETSATTGASHTLATGNVSPSFNGEILVTGIVFEASVSAVSCNNGFSTAFFSNYSVGVFYGIAACYKIQTSATAEGTTWNWTSDVGASTVISSLQAPAAAGLVGGRALLGVGQ